MPNADRNAQLSIQDLGDTGPEDVTELSPGDIKIPARPLGSNTKLKKSIQRLPFFSSVAVLRTNGQTQLPYEAVTGRRRIQLAREAGRETIPALVLPDRVKKFAELIALAENTAREGSALQEARAIRSILDSGVSPGEIARHGIPKNTQHKRLKLLDLPEPLIVALENEEIGTSIAETVAGFSDALQERCADYYRENGHLRMKDARRLNDANKQEEVSQLTDEVFEIGPDSAPSDETREEASTGPRDRLREAVEDAKAMGLPDTEILSVVQSAL